MLRVPEAAALLGIGTRTLYRLVEERKVPHLKLGGAVRFERTIRVEWIHSQMLQGADHVGTSTREPVDVRLRDLRREGGARSAAGSPLVARSAANGRLNKRKPGSVPTVGSRTPSEPNAPAGSRQRPSPGLPPTG